MCRISTTILVAACLALTGTIVYGQIVTYPDMNCDESKVGYTFPMSDPLSYYTCRDPNTPMIFECVQGSGYISNGTMTGCVPWVLWDCTTKSGAPACTKDQQLMKFPHVTPYMYYMCQGIGVSEVLECPEGSAFISSGDNEGCQPWSVWSESCPF